MYVLEKDSCNDLLRQLCADFNKRHEYDTYLESDKDGDGLDAPYYDRHIQKRYVRGLTTLEIHPAMVILDNPRNRFLSSVYRKNNIIAQLAEIVWVLGGRKDMDFLKYYLPNAVNFSDDGVTWRAAYGPRLRNWSGVDQVDYVINAIKKDKYTRQAVISIWDPYKEIMAFKEGGTKDFPCFTYDTIVHSPEGNIKIGEIKKGYPVYCYDKETESITIKPVLKSGKTDRKRIWRVHLDDGSFIETTKNHKFMVRCKRRLGHEKQRGSSVIYKYVKVKDLNLNDRLVPINYIYDWKGYKFVNLYPKKNWEHKNRIKESRLYWEHVNGPIESDFVIHHKDGNKSNNKIENLSCITSLEHDCNYSAFERLGKDNPNYSGKFNYSKLHKPRHEIVYSPEELIVLGRKILKK